jgi:predicted RNase H-like HicB family nuclease
MKYAVIIEKGDTSYGASVPDLPGCIAVGETLEEVQRLIREAIAFHLEGMTLEGLPIPEPTTLCEYVEWREGGHDTKHS